MSRWVFICAMLLAFSASTVDAGAEPASQETCGKYQPIPTPPGTWQPIQYPTPLRNFLFGSARWQPDPNYRWQPGHWVPVDAPVADWRWQPGHWIPDRSEVAQ